MAIRKLLLIAAAFIAMLAGTIIFFGHDQGHEAIAMVKPGDDQAAITLARRSFWNGDIAKAEQLYQTVTERSADNINAWGELGNIYYIQKKFQQAAVAYTEVALQLIDKNDLPQADYYHRLVSLLDRQQTERINERLKQIYKVSQAQS